MAKPYSGALPPSTDLQNACIPEQRGQIDLQNKLYNFLLELFVWQKATYKGKLDFYNSLANRQKKIQQNKETSLTKTFHPEMTGLVNGEQWLCLA